MFNTSKVNCTGCYLQILRPLDMLNLQGQSPTMGRKTILHFINQKLTKIEARCATLQDKQRSASVNKSLYQ